MPLSGLICEIVNSVSKGIPTFFQEKQEVKPPGYIIMKF